MFDKPLVKSAKKTLKIYLVGTGLAANFLVIWIAAGGPIYIDRWLDVTAPPIPAAFIVCPTAGLTNSNLPTDAGWRCIYTAVQLYVDGLGRKIIFTGGGAGSITEAEVYAEAAGWLGCPKEATQFEPGASSTADHPRMLLLSPSLGISRGTVLNIVSSANHSLRLALCFKKAGFRDFRLVSRYVSRSAEPSLNRELLISRFAFYKPNGKTYDDVFNRLRTQNIALFEALREFAAIAYYKMKGYL